MAGGTAWKALLATAAIALIAPAAARADFTPGAAGLGDPFFPDAGNGGYDVGTYDLALDYTPKSRELVGKATITAVATQDLSAFNLDFRPALSVDALTVDGATTAVSRAGQELTATPAAGIPTGATFTVVVDYSGRPKNVVDPDGSKDGWVPTDDGAYVAAEPQGAPTWFPCNDYPTDKALFRIAVTVPRGTEAVANGRLVSRSSANGRTTWTYSSDGPMATYLATATIGEFQIDQARVAGIRSLVAVDPRVAQGSKAALSKQGRILRLWKRLFGAYPFADTGVIVDHAPKVGYALETQTRPLFDNEADSVTLAHELAHQWFGDSVSLRSWPDMWLNEGFATWAEWRWREEQGGPTVRETFRLGMSTPASDRMWAFPSAVIPEPSQLFATPVYVRGALALEALRQRIGDKDFYVTLQRWAATYRYSNATTADFIALAEKQSGSGLLDQFLARWLYEPGKP